MPREIERIRLLAKMTYREYQRRLTGEKKNKLAIGSLDSWGSDRPAGKKQYKTSGDPDAERIIAEHEKQELEALQQQQAELDAVRQSESLEILRREIASLRSALQKKPSHRPDEKEIIAAKMARIPPPELPATRPQRKYGLNQLQSELAQWSDDFFHGEQQTTTPRKEKKLFDYFGGI